MCSGKQFYLERTGGKHILSKVCIIKNLERLAKNTLQHKYINTISAQNLKLTIRDFRFLNENKVPLLFPTYLTVRLSFCCRGYHRKY